MPRLAVLIAILLTASTAVAAPRIYTYLDAQGQRHYTDVPDNNRYRLLVLSPQDRTASGDRYDFQLLAKATQYDSIIEHAAVSSALEPNLLARRDRGGIGIQFARGVEARRGRPHAVDAGDRKPLWRLKSL